jgi:hypothetical protein
MRQAGNTVGNVLILTLYITVRETPTALYIMLHVRVVLRMDEFVSRMMVEQRSGRYVTSNLAWVSSFLVSVSVKTNIDFYTEFSYHDGSKGNSWLSLHCPV